MKVSKSSMKRRWLNDTEGGWIAHRLSLISSPAWLSRPRPLARILERLEIEHMRHGGKENGNLRVSYDQFVAQGVSRKVIRRSLAIGQQLGLLKVSQQEECTGDVRPPNRYSLTYVPERGRQSPTDEWSSITKVEAAAFVAEFNNAGRREKI